MTKINDMDIEAIEHLLDCGMYSQANVELWAMTHNIEYIFTEGEK